MTANVFNIQKFSIHDGPGIRTIVFFKGCPLRCLWCSNPESQAMHTQILWDAGKCIHCGQCVSLCPTNSITFQNGCFSFNHKTCSAAQLCTSRCPNEALEYTGKMMTIEAVISEVQKDLEFYKESGGGVTLSGGEVLVWHRFAKELLIRLHEEQIHTALETTGYAAESVFREVTSHAGMLLFDVKHYDPNRHLEVTGVSNELILKNMTWAVRQRMPVTARIPVIPGINNTIDDAEGFCRLLHKTGITQVNLLPFHQFGQKKYEMLQLDYAMKEAKALYPEDLTQYKEVFVSNGFDTKI